MASTHGQHTPSDDEVTVSSHDDEIAKDDGQDLSVPEQETDETSTSVDSEDASTSASEGLTPVVTHPATVMGGESRHGIRRFFGFFGRHKIWTTVFAVVIVVGILAAVPWTRYKIAGLVLKQTITVDVIDSQTHQPVTSAKVAVGTVSAKTDNHGQARLHVAVGPRRVTVEKTYYQTGVTQTTVPILKPKHVLNTQLKATGRQVPVTVTNLVTGHAIDNAVIEAAGTEVKTNASGQAIIVLPADKTSVSATVAATGFNNKAVTLQITTTLVAANKLQLTPSGQLYFLSNLSGKIDVVKTNLDGTSRQTVLAGTGKEDPNDTVLLATRDWKYLALLSNRTGSANPELYLIDTSNDKLSTIDQSNSSFDSIGWDGHDFIYYATRNTVSNWQSGQQVLESYNADTGTTTALDQTAATGTSQSDWMQQRLGDAYILNNAIVYSMNWETSTYSPFTGKQATLNVVNPDGTGKKVVQSFSLASGNQAYQVELNLRPYEADGLYVYFSDGTNNHFYDYEDGALKADTTLTPNSFWDSTYNTYLLSPSGSQTFWSEQRDGKNTLFVGDEDGNNGKQIATLSDYAAYGWYTDNYLLVSKGSNELYIMPVTGGTPVKVTDYYQTGQNFTGYGSGYGGL